MGRRFAARNLENPGVVDLGTESSTASRKSLIPAAPTDCGHVATLATAVRRRRPAGHRVASGSNAPSVVPGSGRRWLTSWTRLAVRRTIGRCGGRLLFGAGRGPRRDGDPRCDDGRGRRSARRALWWVLAGVSPLRGGLFAFWRRPSTPSVRCLLVAASLLAVSTFFEYLCGPAGSRGPRRRCGCSTPRMLTDTGASLAGVGFFALFPVGRPERRYERMIVRTAVAIALLVPATCPLARPELTVNPFSFSDFPPVANPTFVPALSPIGGLVLAAYVGFWMVALPLAALMLALRYRRSGFAERRQIRWLLLGASVGALGTVPWVLGLDALGAVIGVPCMLATVGCIVVALLDAGLLDVDAIIRKSLVYGILWLLHRARVRRGAAGARRRGEPTTAVGRGDHPRHHRRPGRSSRPAVGWNDWRSDGCSGTAEPLRGRDQVRRRPGGGGRPRRPAPEAGRDDPDWAWGCGSPRVRLDPPPDPPDAQMPQAQSGTGAEPEWSSASSIMGSRSARSSADPSDGSVHGRRHPTARDPRPTGRGRRLRPSAAYRAGAEHLAEISRTAPS